MVGRYLAHFWNSSSLLESEPAKRARVQSNFQRSDLNFANSAFDLRLDPDPEDENNGKPGTVVSTNPLKVQPHDWGEGDGHSWDEVRPVRCGDGARRAERAVLRHGSPAHKFIRVSNHAERLATCS